MLLLLEVTSAAAAADTASKKVCESGAIDEN